MILLATIVCGLAAAGLTATIRAVLHDHKPERLLEKPFSCDLCMSFWSSLGFSITLAFTGDIPLHLVPLATFGGVGVALILVKAASRLSS